MKKKLIILTLCFTIIISSINFKKVDALDFVISPTIVAVVATLGVGAGLVLRDNDDITNLGREFYNYYKDQMDLVELAFTSAVTLNPSTGVTDVGSDFLDYCSDFFDSVFGSRVDFPTTFDSPISKVSVNEPIWSYPVRDGSKYSYEFYYDDCYGTVNISTSATSRIDTASFEVNYIVDGERKTVTGSKAISYSSSNPFTGMSVYVLNKTFYLAILGNFNVVSASMSGFVGSSNTTTTLPNASNYDWDKVEEKIGGGVYVPGNTSSLVGDNITVFPTDDVFNPPYDLPTDGIVSVPGIGEGTMEGVNTDTGTSSSVWDKVKDFIISLVVPSDTFWTDTFGGLRNSFNDAFPMVDMSNFNNLIVGGKPFPNIYITVFGSRAKVVDGDVINSIVDWLKPLVAGFMMLCLMLYNYRKIYKLIRNTEPFGPIAPGTSDFRTGMSAPGMSVNNTYEIAQAQIRDVMFDMRNEMLSRKYGKD